MSKTIAITTLLICGTVIVVLLLVAARLYKNNILKLLSCFFALLISAGTIFGAIALSNISGGAQSNNPYTNFHGVTPLSPPPNVITLAGNNATTIVSLRGDTGAQLWQYTIDPNSTVQNTILNENSVYSIVNNDTTSLLSVIAFRADNGHTLWRFDLTPAKLHIPYSDTITATSSPTVANDMLYLNITYANNNALCAFHTNNGSLLNCQSLNGYNLQAPTTSANDLQGIHTVGLSQTSTVQGGPSSLDAPLVTGNVVLAAPTGLLPKRLQAFAGDTLLPLWSYQLNLNGTIIGANEFFYIYDSTNHQIDALQSISGQLAWTISTSTLPTQFVKPILTTTHLYLYESNNLQGAGQTIIAFDLHTGKQDWQAQLPMRIGIATIWDITPVETDHTLYIIQPNNTLISLNTDTGGISSRITIPPLQIQNTNCSVTNIVSINVLHNVLFLSLQYANLSSRRSNFFNIGTSNDPCNGIMSISAISPHDSFAYWDYIYHDQSNQSVPILLQNTFP